MTVKSRVPDDLSDESTHKSFLDAIDRRQLRLGQLSDLEGTASLTDVINAINAILATHRTK